VDGSGCLERLRRLSKISFWVAETWTRGANGHGNWRWRLCTGRLHRDPRTLWTDTVTFSPTWWWPTGPKQLLKYYLINKLLCSNVSVFDIARGLIVFKNSVIVWLLNKPTRGREWHRSCARHAFCHTQWENFTPGKTKSGYRWGRRQNIETVLVETVWKREGSSGAVQFPVDIINALVVSLRVT
jgi:hypothetical protein